MISEQVAVELRRWPVRVYTLISACTVAVALYLAFATISDVMRDGFSGYCYHGGGGELSAWALWALVFLWPVIALQIVLSFFAAKRIGRVAAVAVTAALPTVVLMGLTPCF